MVPDEIRRLAVRDLPQKLAACHVDRGDASVRRLEVRQALWRGRGRAAAVAAEPFAGGAGTRRRRIGASVLARPGDVANARQRVAEHVREIGELLARCRHETDRHEGGVRGRVKHLRLGIVRAARPVRAARGSKRGEGPLRLAHHRRREDRSRSVAQHQRDGFGAKCRGEVDQTVGCHALVVVRGRLDGERLRRRIRLARHIALRDGTLLDRPDGLPRRAIEHIHHRLLAHDGDRLDGPAVHGDVFEDGRRRDVHVPERMVDELKVPLAHTRLQIHRHEAVGEEVVTGTPATVEVRRGCFDGQVDQAQLLVHRHLIPDAGIAVERPGVLLPRVVAELAGSRNRVKVPEPSPCPDVERLDDALGVVVGFRRVPFPECRADDHDAVRDGGRGVETNLARDEVDRLAGAEHGGRFQIHRAVLAERGNPHACPGVERDQLEARRDVEDPFVAVAGSAVGPVRHATAGELTRCGRATCAFGLAVDPAELAGGGVDRHHGAPGAGRGVDDTTDHERRPLELELRPGAEVVRFDPPGDLEVVEVRRRDLGEWRVMVVAIAAVVRRPLAVRRARWRALGRQRGPLAVGQDCQHCQGGDAEP